MSRLEEEVTDCEGEEWSLVDWEIEAGEFNTGEGTVLDSWTWDELDKSLVTWCWLDESAYQKSTNGHDGT